MRAIVSNDWRHSIPTTLTVPRCSHPVQPAFIRVDCWLPGGWLHGYPFMAPRVTTGLGGDRSIEVRMSRAVQNHSTVRGFTKQICGGNATLKSVIIIIIIITRKRDEYNTLFGVFFLSFFFQSESQLGLLYFSLLAIISTKWECDRMQMWACLRVLFRMKACQQHHSLSS